MSEGSLLDAGSNTHDASMHRAIQQRDADSMVAERFLREGADGKFVVLAWTLAAGWRGVIIGAIEDASSISSLPMV